MRAFLSFFIVCISLGASAHEGETVSAKPSRIVYVNADRGSWGLYASSADGKEQKLLLSIDDDIKAPAISPDGSKVVFSTNKGQIKLLDLTQTDAEPVPVSVPGGYSDQPAWHPDGQRLAVFSLILQSEENSDIFLVDINKRVSPRRLVQNDRMKTHPVFSPDGKQLAFSLFHRTATQVPIEEIWFQDLESGEQISVTEISAESFKVDWAPDGKSILFTSNVSGNYDIWSVHLESAKLMRLTTHPGYDGDAVFSPDGQHIAFVSARTGKRQIWLMSADGHDLHQLTFSKTDCKDPDWGLLP